jgi:hypothetical protein
VVHGIGERRVSYWCDLFAVLQYFTLCAYQTHFEVGYINFIITVRSRNLHCCTTLADLLEQLIGINLCISVAYNVHTSGWTAYYIGGSLIASFIIMIPGG